MEDLIQCPVARDDLQRWLEMGNVPITVWQGEKANIMLLRLEKRPSVDYLYRTTAEQDYSISWNNGLTFCGVYDAEHRTLYLTGDSLYSFMDGKLIAEAGPSMTETISGRINRRVEELIANDRGNLPVQEVTSRQALSGLEYYRNYAVKEVAIRNFLSGRVPDRQFHSGYALNELPEAVFIAWLQDPEMFIQAETEQYIKSHQEELLVDFLEKEALLAEYQALTQDLENPIHRMKAITDAVRSSGAKTVTVTVQKDGRELTFKAAANSLIGYQDYYNTYEIPAPDRREFERLFGRYANYSAEDITRITYGRNTIYEAPFVPTEEQTMGPTMEMGGM